MTKLHLSIFISLFSLTLFSQTKKVSAESIADCAGAVNLFKSGDYTIQFTGTGGNTDELSGYPSLTDVSDNNLVWVSYIAEFDGMLSFDASISQDYLQMIVFEETTSNICIELPKGIAEIKRVHKQKDQKSVGLNVNISAGVLYPLEMIAGQKIMIAFSTAEKSKAMMKLNFIFKETDNGIRVAHETKIIDNRDDEFAPTLSIQVRDSETNEPITANVTIDGVRDMTALYKGSDILFNAVRASKIIIKCDAEGYFFLDREESLTSSNQEIILKMERIKKGKSFPIEEIEFKPGTSEFMPGSDSKLRRLKDFMALNADINVEIQGHVFSIGENNVANQKMSEARAKRVVNYLVDNGISKERMVAVGYGNTKPIYPDPKLSQEEQANRRVEILVK